MPAFHIVVLRALYWPRRPAGGAAAATRDPIITAVRVEQRPEPIDRPGSGNRAAPLTQDWSVIVFVDRIHRLPRIWSNRELARFAHLFAGDVVNVSAWKDEDKEGRRYRDYFSRARSYTITNFKTEARGFQGMDQEIFLDLEGDLPGDLAERFDVVFNHTTLEHIYDAQTAFRNLCRMSRDVVILVVPFLQPYHSDYGDYWRFSPLLVKRLLEDSGLEALYLSYNSHRRSSVYVFAVASRHPDRWREHFPYSFTDAGPGDSAPMSRPTGAADRSLRTRARSLWSVLTRRAGL